MPSHHRKHRGYATQRLVAQWFAKRGWPFAESTGAGRSGVDVTGLPGLSAEVKATAGDVTGALRQAHSNRGEGLPFVVWRPNGYGQERIASWPVILRLDDFTELLHAAGYGDALTEQGDEEDTGDDFDPWKHAMSPQALIDAQRAAQADPPQPYEIPCPRMPDCELVGEHKHMEHP